MFDLTSNGLATEPSPYAGGGKGIQSPMGAEERSLSLSQILAGQVDHLHIVRDRRQDIDKSKELCLEKGVVHGQIECLVRPPASLKESGGSSCRETGELFTDTGYDRFERGGNFRHRYLTANESGDSDSIHRDHSLETFMRIQYAVLAYYLSRNSVLMK
jgi:hypothetical protein